MKVRVLLLATFTLLTAAAAFAQSHEVALTSGGLKIGERGFDLPQPGFLKFSSGLTYQLSYAQRLLDAKLAALYFEIPLAGTPRTKVNTQNALTPKTYSSLFFTPGVKLKLLRPEVFAFCTDGRWAGAFSRRRYSHKQSTQPESVCAD